MIISVSEIKTWSCPWKRSQVVASHSTTTGTQEGQVYKWGILLEFSFSTFPKRTVEPVFNELGVDLFISQI